MKLERFNKAFRIERLAAGEDGQTVASLSSEDAVSFVPSMGVNVRLSHGKEAIELEDQIPLLWSHDHSAMPLGAVRALHSKAGKLRGTIVWGTNEAAQAARRDAEAGILRGVSIGAQPLEVREEANEDGSYTVTRWRAVEASLTNIPADRTVGIGREGEAMEPGKAVDLDTVRTEAKAAEAQRTQAICEAFEPVLARGAKFAALQGQALKENWAIERAYQEIQKAILTTDDAPTASLERSYITAGPTDLMKFSDQAAASLLTRNGIATKEQAEVARNSETMGMSLRELAREWLRLNNVKPSGDIMRMVGQALVLRSGGVFGAHTTSDFAGILANVAENAMLRGWSEAPETWAAWTRPGTLSDFKQARRSGLGEFPDIDVVPESGEFKYKTITDRYEPIQLTKGGALFSISREAIVNDDQGHFVGMPAKMARAASRRIGDAVYLDILTANSGVGPTLTQDATALFNAASHGNYVTSGAAPSVATLNTAFTAMATQTDNDGVTTLNIAPRYILSPMALRGTVDPLISAMYDPSGTAGTLTPNPHYRALTPIYDGRLDGFNAAGWWLAADPSMNDTIEVAGLNGSPTPRMEQAEGFTVEGAIYKVSIEWAVAALGYQGLYYNDGVT